MTDHTDKFANDNTPKLLGFEYQKFIALEYALSAPPGEVIYLECLGDVANSKVSVEAKHHFTPHNLGSHSPDFWKTLKNWIVEIDTIKNFKELHLHTTSKIPEGSIFNGWNQLDTSQRYSSLTDCIAAPPKSIAKFCEVVFSFSADYNQSDLLDVLSKVHIKSEMPNINAKFESLKEHSAFLGTDPKRVEAFIEWLLGYITHKAINNSDRWHIKQNDFKKDFERESKNYAVGVYQFPEISKDDITPDADASLHKFVQELRNIDLKSEEQKAVYDFYRACSSKIKIIADNPTFIRHVENFDDELLDNISSTKRQMALNILPDEGTIKDSKKLFYQCNLLRSVKIHQVENVRPYFQRGMIYTAVNCDKFSWIFKIEDLV